MMRSKVLASTRMRGGIVHLSFVVVFVILSSRDLRSHFLSHFCFYCGFLLPLLLITAAFPQVSFIRLEPAHLRMSSVSQEVVCTVRSILVPSEVEQERGTGGTVGQTTRWEGYQAVTPHHINFIPLHPYILTHIHPKTGT